MADLERKRVVVTGLGAITPLGNTVSAYWQGLLQGMSGIGPITLFDASQLRSRIAGEVKGFDPCDYLNRKEIQHTDRFTQLAVCASQQAITDANFKINELNACSVGVLIGTGVGGIKTIEDQQISYLSQGPDHCHPFAIPMMTNNMAAGLTALQIGARGPTSCTVTACAAGSNAIGEAFRLIQHGYAQAMICGGTEAAITPLTVTGFSAAKALSTQNDDPVRASRPFDRNRDGFVIGEGVGILFLEEMDHALSRSAHIYAEIVGYGATCDAHHMTAPLASGKMAARAIELAIKDACLDRSEIDYINAHGTSTRMNDVVETRAIKTALKDHANRVAISSTKSMTGHLLGASGGIEAIATVLAVATDQIPPTINLSQPDPECDLDYVPHQNRKQRVYAALSNSFGFGGHNVTLAFKKLD